MTTFRVTNYNQYSTKKENNRTVSVVEIEAESRTRAMDAAEVMAKRWNWSEARENMKVNMMVCEGHFRAV